MFVPSVTIPAPTVSPSVIASRGRGSGRYAPIYPISVVNGEGTPPSAIAKVDAVRPIQITTGGTTPQPSNSSFLWNVLLGAAAGAALQVFTASKAKGAAKFTPALAFAVTYFLAGGQSKGLKEFALGAGLTSGVLAGAGMFQEPEAKPRPRPLGPAQFPAAAPPVQF